MKPLPFHITMGFAGLVDRVHEAAFDVRFPANGKFIRLARGDRAYWYHIAYDPERPSKQRSRYAGIVVDPTVDSLVSAHGRLHADRKARKALASSMRQSGRKICNSRPLCALAALQAMRVTVIASA